jgi:hypothetical protein
MFGSCLYCQGVYPHTKQYFNDQNDFRDQNIYIILFYSGEEKWVQVYIAILRDGELVAMGKNYLITSG